MSQGKPEQLVVRQHERYRVTLRAEISVAPEHADKVVLSRSGSDGAGVVRAVLVDCSSGGLALHSTAFFPKTCRVVLRIIEPGAPIVPQGQRYIFESAMRVMRVMMLNREPTYYVGCAFANPGPETMKTMERLLEHARLSEATAKREEAARA